MFENIRQFLYGKKSYIVAILTIILGLLQNNQNMVLQGIALITVRAAISKVSN